MTETTPMIGRVAEALAAEWSKMVRPALPGMPYWREMARAAIEAMRESTPAMIKAAVGTSAGYGSFDDPMVTEDAAKEVWQIMIDAALGEKP